MGEDTLKEIKRRVFSIENKFGFCYLGLPGKQDTCYKDWWRDYLGFHPVLFFHQFVLQAQVI